MKQEVERGGISLPIPEQEIVEDGGRFRLGYRVPLPVESWNEQISLLTGMAAAALMLHARDRGAAHPAHLADRGDPPAAPGRAGARRRLARQTVVRRDDPRARPVEPAPRRAARGGDVAAPRRRLHGVRRRRAGAGDARRGRRAVRPRDGAAASARRPVRRRGVRLALCAGVEVPGWVRSALPGLPARDGRQRPARRRARAGVRRPDGGRRARAARSGRTFDAVVVDVGRRRAAAPCSSPTRRCGPAARATCRSASAVRVRLLEADVEPTVVRFAAGLSDRYPGGHGGRAGRAAASRALGSLAEESPGSTGQGGG